MSFIKGVMKIILGVSLSVLLCTFIISFSFSEATKPEVIKPLFEGLVESSMPADFDLNGSYQEILFLCVNKTSIELPLQENSRENTTVSCDKVRNGNPSILIDIIADSLFDKIYYKNYGCSFLGCFKGNFDPLFLFSESANALLMDFAYLLLAIFIILLLLSLPLIKLKTASLIFIINGLPSLLSLIVKDIPSNIRGIGNLNQLTPFFSSFINSISLLSLGCLAIGFVLLILSIFVRKTKTKPKKK